MQYPGYNSGNVILSEGEWFPFVVYNIVQLQDGELYYILLDTNGLKHFMSVSHYVNYGIKKGDTIDCKIEKINCTGRIYLEPKHPYYKEGEIYTFNQVEFLNSGEEKVLIVKDYFGNSIEVPVCNKKIVEVKKDKLVSCIVKTIRKGRPMLEMKPTIS